jgi:hypothetical protein
VVSGEATDGSALTTRGLGLGGDDDMVEADGVGWALSMRSRSGDPASATAGSAEVGPTDCLPYIMTIVAMTKPSVPIMTSSGPPRISLGGRRRSIITSSW